MTKYEMITGKIRQRIREEVYQGNSLIPDQVSLAKEFNVSRMTVKSNGYLRTRRTYPPRSEPGFC